MKKLPFLLLLPVLISACATPTKPPTKAKTTFSSFDPVQTGGKVYGPNEINFKDMALPQFLFCYQEISGRTVIRPANLPTPGITIRNEQPLTRIGVLRLFDTALAANNIALVLVGEDAVKALPAAEAAREPGPVINLPPDQLPESGSFMVRMVKLKRASAGEVLPLLRPLARLPNGIITTDDARLLILRDYSANIRTMLKVIEEVERRP